MLRTCTHGQTGPLAKQPALGFTLTTLAGFNNITGWPDRDCNELHGAYSDFIVPLFGGFSVIAALDYRRRTGKGQCLDLSQHEASLQFLSPLLLENAVNKRDVKLRGNTCPYAAPHGAYRCSGEDRWCAISVFTDEEWNRFCSVIGNPEWTKNPKFSTTVDRIKNSNELDILIEDWTSKRDAEDVMARMQAAGVPAGLVANAKDMMENPQFEHYGYFNQLEHAEIGMRSYYQRAPFKLSKATAEPSAPPLLGEHNEHVCRKLLNMSSIEYNQLVEDGVFD
jgi:crotonobetainyl-CoA:carnitine CoA-transferase CaiB-like acyl-CoA transferase